MKEKIHVDITTRKDIHKLVSLFYSKVKKEKLLGPIFNHVISDWSEHIERLTDFWETNLFATAIYTGNPIEAHQKVDKTSGGSITEMHFGIWLQLWFGTIDELYRGEKAAMAKRRARKMSTHLYLKMYESRDTTVTTCPFTAI